MKDSMTANNQTNSYISQRAHVRVDFFNKVHVQSIENGTALDVFAGNVSMGGMFLRCNQPLPEGKTVKLAFETKDGQVNIDEGRIIWTKKFEPIDLDGNPPGMGIQFIKMSAESQKIIKAFIEDTLANDHGSHGTLTTSPPPAADISPATQPVDSTLALDEISAPPLMEISEPPAEKAILSKLDIIKDKPAISPEPVLPKPRSIVEDRSEMYMFSTPPSPKKRLFVFGGFVLLVASATFFLLLIFKPPKATKPDTKATASAPKTISQPAVTPEPKPEPKPEVKPEPKPEPKPEVKPEPKPEPTPEPKPEPVKTSKSIGFPEVVQTASGWQMIFEAGSPLKIKHFTLKAPPRLVVDFYGATFTEKSTVKQSSLPFVSKIRVGKKEELIRFVLDFSGSRIPKFQTSKTKNSISITFP
jgi:uncharacterized protein (TIGR02266 family)